jgi:hypothetical protein
MTVPQNCSLDLLLPLHYTTALGHKNHDTNLPKNLSKNTHTVTAEGMNLNLDCQTVCMYIIKYTIQQSYLCLNTQFSVPQHIQFCSFQVTRLFPTKCINSATRTRARTHTHTHTHTLNLCFHCSSPKFKCA